MSSLRPTGGSSEGSMLRACVAEQFSEHIIEDTPNGAHKPEGRTHYMPYQVVLTPSKTTTKIRVVYDGSAQLSKAHPSLNDCMHRGPIDLPLVPGILLRFRQYKICITADVAKAFLQIGLHPPDRQCVQFFWYADESKALEGPAAHNLKIMRFARVPFGIITSPYLLQGTIEYHLKNNELAKKKRPH
jgi:hypothetical protein